MNQLDIVIPDGSMQKVVMGLIEKAFGLPIVVEKERTKEGKIDVDWIRRIAFQRPQEIPTYLKKGHFDVAIVGEDWIDNWGYKFHELFTLPIGRSGDKPVRIVLAVSRVSGIRRLEELPQGCEVATEYKELAQRYFSENGRPDIEIVPSIGNTETKVGFGATAIIDVVEKGDSIRENELEIIRTIMESYTAVVANPRSYSDKDKRPYIDCFDRLLYGAFQASLYVKITANVPEKVVEQASSIIYGLKGPTCSPLIGVKGWFALQSIVPKDKETDIIFKLLEIGVDDIIVDRGTSLIMSK